MRRRRAQWRRTADRVQRRRPRSKQDGDSGHSEWLKPLFAELDRHSVPYVALHAAEHVYDPDELHSPYALVVNRSTL